MAHENGAPYASSDTSPGDFRILAPGQDSGPGEVSLQRATLSERIVALPPPKSMEAFRTKVKVKAPIPVQLSPGGDDLTRIRGIDTTLASRLAAIGVSRFAQIAAWAQTDVQNISQILDLGRTISRQNWIEQAALLSGPSQTNARTASTSAGAELLNPPPQVAPAVDQQPPVVPVPVVPLPLNTGMQETLGPDTWLQVPEFAVPVPFVPEAVTPQAVLAPPPTLPSMLPRVITVDSPGDAKFHQAVVHLMPLAVPAPLWAPSVPVPEVPMPTLIVPTILVAAASVADQTPFQVPVPVVAEPVLITAVVVPSLVPIAEREASPPTLPDVSPIAPLGFAAAENLTGTKFDTEDDILATQLHAAVTAAADDRAVAATINLLSAFSPPPLVDEAGFPDLQGWAPDFRTASVDRLVQPASELGADRAEAEADIAFTRWVPTSPLAVPTAVSIVRRPEPWPFEPLPTMRAAAQAVAASAADPHSSAPTTSSMWARPHDRWSEPEPAVPVAAPPVPAVQHVPTTLAPLEPVAPTMLDRLASLEAELTALAANDQPRAHAAVALAATVGSAPQYRGPSQLPRALQQTPDQSRSLGRRAGVRPEPTPMAAKTLPELPLANRPIIGGEADVMIVPRDGDTLEIRAILSGPSVGTLEQRMRRARPAPEVDVETYAGYHAAISEASVEIVRCDTHTRAVVFSETEENSEDAASRGREGSVRKFFKALKGS